MSKAPHYSLYGWHLSYFTGKALCYLRYKRINFTFKQVNAFTLMHTVKKKTGAVVMPVVKSDDGQWIQDTSSIIDWFEQNHPKYPVIPTTPVHRYLSYWIEAWGDEWWVPMAMYTRWAHKENYELFRRDAGGSLLPFFPKFVQDFVAARPAYMMRTLLPDVGVKPQQYEAMDLFMEQMLDALDAHFAKHLFLLGGRPTLGDFGLVGTMYGHLARDPWPKRNLVDPRPNLSAWVKRMSNPYSYTSGELFPNDKVPATLNRVIRSIVDEFAPMVQQTGQLACDLAKEVGLGVPLPRGIGLTRTTMAGKPFERQGLGIKIWMVQRATDCYERFTDEEAKTVQEFLKKHRAEGLLNLNLPRVERRALTIAVTQLPESMEHAA